MYYIEITRVSTYFCDQKNTKTTNKKQQQQKTQKVEPAIKF